MKEIGRRKSIISIVTSRVTRFSRECFLTYIVEVMNGLVTSISLEEKRFTLSREFSLSTSLLFSSLPKNPSPFLVKDGVFIVKDLWKDENHS